MALTNWNDILNKPNGVDEVPEIALTVEQLSASVLSISEDVGEIALDVSQLSASVLSIGGDVNNLKKVKSRTFTINVECTAGSAGSWGYWGANSEDITTFVAENELLEVIPTACRDASDMNILGIMNASITTNQGQTRLYANVNSSFSHTYECEILVRYKEL